MIRCELATRARPDGVEIFAAPAVEPLASCAFEWPAGWAGAGAEWTPPGLGARSPLFSLVGEGGRLDVEVARFGCEVDGLAFAAEVWPTLADRAWRGLPLAGGRLDDAQIRVVHSGPALHLLIATGTARDHVDRASATLRTLSGRPPIAEPLAPLQVGPFKARRLAAWGVDLARAEAHGHSGATLVAETPKRALGAQVRLRVVDRRIHVGVDPEQLLALEDKAWAGLPLSLEAPRLEHGPEGPSEVRAGRYGGEPVEWRRALRQFGPAVVVATGLWPSFARAPVMHLNGRRHFDIVLSTAAG